MCVLCQAETAVKERLRAAQRLAIAAYDEHFGYDVALRRVYRPRLSEHPFDRELGKLEVVETLRRKG